MVFIPTVIEKQAAMEHAYDLYSCLLKERVILLTGEINDTLSASICAQLLYLASKSTAPITIYINSIGGSVSAGLAILDTMNYIACDIQTIAMGICASMGAVILSAGTKGKRFALKNSEIMIHQPLGGMQGQATDMEIAAKHILQMKDRLYQILASNCNTTVAVIEQSCERDYYMDAKQALQFQMIDKIIEHQNQI